MLITLFLVLINIFNTITTNSPNTEGMTAIAAWMLVCIFFVCGALFGYAWLLWKKKKSCLKRKRFSKKLTDEELKARSIWKEDFRTKVDDIFLVFFPLMFLIFNLVGLIVNFLFVNSLFFQFFLALLADLFDEKLFKFKMTGAGSAWL